MKRALLFLLIFLSVLVFVFAVTFLPNVTALKTLLTNNESLFEGNEYVDRVNSLKDLAVFIGEHPEYVSIASLNPDQPDSAFYYMEDTPRTLGTLGNILLLAGYEAKVERGELQPDMPVNIQEIEQITLPKIDNRTHKRALSALKSIHSRQVTLGDVVTVMAAENDPALADYLWFTIGRDFLQTLKDSLELDNTDLPLPFAGLYIAAHPGLADTTRTYTPAEITDFAERFKNDPEYNAQVKKQFKKNRLGLNFMQERDALAKFPKTTVRDLSQLMLKLYSNELLSEDISEKIKNTLRRIYNDNDLSELFADYGALYDSRMGMTGGIDFGISKQDGNVKIQAVIFDSLPVAFWLHMYSNHMQGDYQQRLIWDPLLYQTTIREILKTD